MGLFLKILGLTFLLLIVFVVVVVLTIRAKLKKFAKTLEGMSSGVAASLTPPRIHLAAMASHDWDNPAAVGELVESVRALGFQDAGQYEVTEVAGLRLQAFLKPDESINAVVYEHPRAGVWLDIYTHFEDGTRITFANLPPSGVDHAPGHQVERCPGLDAQTMYHKFLEARPDKPMKTYTTPDEFVAAFERVYAEEMDWRNSRGGPSAQEIRHVGELSGKPYTEDEIALTQKVLERRALDDLAETLRERFLEQSALSPDEREELRDRLVIVHDRLTPEMLEEISNEFGGEDLGPPPISDEAGSSPRAWFVTHNHLLPEERRFLKLGALKEPIEADVYRAPEW